MLTLLLKMHLLGAVRSDHFKSWVAGRIVLFLIFVLPALALAWLLGMYLEGAFIRLFGIQDVFPVIHAVIILLLIGIACMEPIMQKEIPIPLQSYLCLPVSRNQLGLLYQIQSGFTLNNLWMFVFLISFWGRSILTRYPPVSAGIWLLLTLILLLGSHFVSNLFRYVLWKSPKLYALLTVTVLFLWGFTLVTHFDSWIRMADFLYTGSLNGDYAGLACSIGFVLFILIVLVYLTARALWLDQRIQRNRRPRSFRRRNEHLVSVQLLIFELRLLHRNTRTKSVFINFLLFPLWGASMLLIGIRDGRVFMLGVGLLLVLNVTGMSYTLIGFRMKSIFYDRLLTLPYRTTSLVQTVVILSHIVTTFSLLLVAVLFILSRKQLLFPLLALYLYSLGVVDYVNTYLAVYNTKRYDITSTAFNRRELTNSTPLMSLAGTVLVSLPPIVLFVLLPGSPKPMLFVLLGVIGVAGMAGHDKWIHAISKGLRKKKYDLLAGFRTN